MSALLFTLPLLVKDAKSLFEDSSILIAVPLLALGVFGVLFMLTPIQVRWPEPSEPEPEPELLPHPPGHPTATQYVQVGAALAILTMVEVTFFYLDLVQGITLAVLLSLTVLKFALVVLWFMHLRFDSPLFSYLFTGGLALAGALFIVVLATLGANLV